VVDGLAEVARGHVEPGVLPACAQPIGCAAQGVPRGMADGDGGAGGDGVHERIVATAAVPVLNDCDDAGLSLSKAPCRRVCRMNFDRLRANGCPIILSLSKDKGRGDQLVVDLQEKRSANDESSSPLSL
jgi:hypothetical protein